MYTVMMTFYRRACLLSPRSLLRRSLSHASQPIHRRVPFQYVRLARHGLVAHVGHSTIQWRWCCGGSGRGRGRRGWFRIDDLLPVHVVAIDIACHRVSVHLIIVVVHSTFHVAQGQWSDHEVRRPLVLPWRCDWNRVVIGGGEDGVYVAIERALSSPPSRRIGSGLCGWRILNEQVAHALGQNTSSGCIGAGTSVLPGAPQPGE